MYKPRIKGVSIAKWVKRPTVKNLKSAIKKATQTFGIGPLGKIINRCPQVKQTPPPPLPPPNAPEVIPPAKITPPPPKPTPPPKPPTVPRVECSIIRVNSICEHKPRTDNANMFLAVVPSLDSSLTGGIERKGIGFEKSFDISSSNKGDKIESTAIMNQSCGKHPIWKVLDEGNLVYDGSGKPSEKLMFEVLPPDLSKQNIPNILGLVWWLKDMKPRNYSIQCIGHNPENRPIVTYIAVYSPVESAISVSFGSVGNSSLEKNQKGVLEVESEFNKKFEFLRSRFESAIKRLAEYIPNIKELEIEILRGSLSLKNNWVEAPVFYKAYWEAEGALNFAPLISINGKCAITPSIPSWIAKYLADAYFYIGLQGDIGGSLAFKWKSGDYNEAKGVVEGAITISLGAEAFVGKDGYKLVSIDISGGSKISAECSLTATVEPQITLDGKIKWDPLIAKVEIEVLDGWFKNASVNSEWTLFEQKELFSGSYEFLSKN